jgi:20S proteasome alpha/beta subunit
MLQPADRLWCTVFYVDSQGTCIESDMFCVGSGAQFAYAILDTAGGESINSKAANTKVTELATPLAVAERQQSQSGHNNPSAETIARGQHAELDSGNTAHQMSPVVQLSTEGEISTTALELSQPQMPSQQNQAPPTQRAQVVLARMSLNEAIDTAVKAVRHATYRDGFSGGYINVLIVNASGIHHVRRVDSRSIPI